MSTPSVDQSVAGVYHFVDPIQNLKIRVKLERLNSNALLPSLGRLKIEEDLSNLLNPRTAILGKGKAQEKDVARAFEEKTRSEFEEVLIGWQQKHFNRREIEIYGDPSQSAVNALEQKYKDEVQKLKMTRRQTKRIYTYIEGDVAPVPDELDFFQTDSVGEEPNPNAIGMSLIRRRRNVQQQFGTNLNVQHGKGGIINGKPTDEDMRNSRMASLPRQTMLIMADLSSQIDTTTGQIVVGGGPLIECVLCKIQVLSNGTIIVEPDFNEGKTAYIAETGAVNNEVYHYFIENGSNKISTEDLIKEQTIFQEICVRQQNQLAQKIGNRFDQPLPTVRLCVFGEIVSGKNFDYEDLYVNYCLDLPENWEAERSMVFSGYTPTASSIEDPKTGEEIIYYSHPFEFEVHYNPSSRSADTALPQMPRIYFHVASQDDWGRHRTAGYTFFDLPNQPGFYSENLSCWRPRGDSIFDEVRAVFIGGSHELDDLSYVAVPKQFEIGEGKTPLSRFGFRTVTTGTLNVRLNVVFQSQTAALEKRKHRRAEFNRGGFEAFMDNITAVISAFQDAKKRAQEAQDSTIRLTHGNGQNSEEDDD